MGEIEERIRIVREADKILKEELARIKMPYDMAEVKIYSIRTVGIKGDERSYEYPVELELRQQGEFIWKPRTIQRLSSRITNEVRGVNRVLYVISSYSAGQTNS